MRGAVYGAFLFAFSILACDLQVVCASKSKDQAQPCWVITSKSADVGISDVFVTADRIKIDDASRGVVLVSEAPRWEIVIYRPREKTYWSGKYDDFYGPGGRTAYMVRGEMFKELKFTVERDATISGTRCASLKGVRLAAPIDRSDRHWVSVKNNKAGTATLVVLTNGKQPKGRRQPSSRSPFSPTAPQAANIIARYYKLPTEGLVPVRFSFSKVKSPTTVVDDLKNRKVVVTKALPKEFAVPRGLKKIATEWQVYLSGGVDNFVEEMTDSLGRH